MDTFFDSPQGAAILKHKLLANYLGVFTGKLGSQAAGGRVVFIDGYAGPGSYADLSPGSPQLALETAEALSGIRRLECFFIESKREHAIRLRELVDGSAVGENCVVKQGTAETELADVMASAGNAPLLAFLDPYGLTVPFDDLVSLLLSRPTGGVFSRSKPTEVLFNFSISAVRRMAGWLHNDSTEPQTVKTRRTMLASLDRFFGGDWWQEHAADGGEDWIEALLVAYMKRLSAAAPGRWSWYAADVSDRYRGPASYYLVHMTQHPDGFWHFNEGVSLGTDALREHTLGGQQELDPKLRKRELIETVTGNLRQLVEKGDPFTLNHKPDEVYGEALGEARTLHVRQAVKDLYAEGLITENPVGFKGDFGRYKVVPTKR